MVSLTYGGWDMHQNIAKNMERQLPDFDKAYAALIRDLDRRGMLEKTIVMVSSEFGRTPKINKDAGRDHWSNAMSVLFAGGGLRMGQYVGETNALGEYPTSRAYGPQNILATLYHVLGIDPSDTVVAAATKIGVPSLVEFFGESVAARLAAEGRQADLIIANNVIAHVPLLNDFVAGIALLTSLLTLANSRLPQLAPLWAIGITRRRLAALELLKTMSVALITALLALPLGLLVAWCLIAIVNVKAFGWRLPFHIFPLQLIELVAVALLAALLAVLLPVLRLARMQPGRLTKIFADER